jgi:hypothetical protein
MSALWLLAVVNAPISGGGGVAAAGGAVLRRANASRNATGDEKDTMSGRKDCALPRQQQTQKQLQHRCRQHKARLGEPERVARRVCVKRRLHVGHQRVAGLERSARARRQEVGPRVADPHAVARQAEAHAGRGWRGAMRQRAQRRRVQRKVRHHLHATVCALCVSGAVPNSCRLLLACHATWTTLQPSAEAASRAASHPQGARASGGQA